MELKERCNKFIGELGLPTTAFCRNIRLSTKSFYDWRNNKTNLSSATLGRIDEYLKRYGF